MFEDLKGVGDGFFAGGVGGLEGSGRGVKAGNVEVGDDDDFLEEVVHCYDGVEEHEKALGYTQYIFHFADVRFGLEVFDAVVADVADRSTCHRGKAKRRDVGDAILGQFGGETGEGVGGEAIVGTGGEDAVGRGADEAVPADGLGCGGGFEEEGVLARGAVMYMLGGAGMGMGSRVEGAVPGGDLEIDGRGSKELGGYGGTKRDQVWSIGELLPSFDNLVDVFHRWQHSNLMKYISIPCAPLPGRW